MKSHKVSGYYVSFTKLTVEGIALKKEKEIVNYNYIINYNLMTVEKNILLN